MKHKEHSECVDRTQRQYETALTRAQKIKTTLQHKFKSDNNSMLKTGYSRRTNIMIVKKIPRINNTVTRKITVSFPFSFFLLFAFSFPPLSPSFPVPKIQPRGLRERC